jgi:hypothetical protein
MLDCRSEQAKHSCARKACRIACLTAGLVDAWCLCVELACVDAHAQLPGWWGSAQNDGCVGARAGISARHLSGIS